MNTISIMYLLKKNRRIIPLIATAMILTTLLIIRAGYRYHFSLQEEIEAKKELYALKASTLYDENDIRNLLKEAENRADELEGGLIDEERPSMGAVKLQKAVKELSSKKGIVISSERQLAFYEDGPYIRIPVEFQFSTGNARLKGLLYDIYASPLIMGARDLRIRVDERKSLDVTLTVEGVMKKR